ncbi:3-deoxy-8-phosphooctulonate synthase [Desulfosudis oleivorans]|uniref:2-dehydro-3-deoxyphosphooctonate aldolase n=1 Tax=Desulfosudis oleivorans (strain DSM 6200 / JCM 39069 / Hxd3) TaxID=96561 RepID=KDSA_DESOH|nr:3-deoxy-8-phosphooctulonate synthase [Desulfosudis oleivorans]A8ZU09.1 RecName: Full=2-dehydro-3-deoxyphosphooctonate aldolase; AltName: Full=3-deoxy-D-manno-octulosonic acid 8-phosphate synthase; AltName: Full=KDO-8-phosphate synthase; Short=KDO 8-P synthase; Short=KDOPS; AltName: Full=Phospho-2-dehydro-3-deoxyoctonate aldolase [Desulfosudis oleivorans Hxd3]ABW66321.1 2-dehydro-3-deoxyphosphooctonate aldolase [Desulfosudis oleivorans Hxd3]
MTDTIVLNDISIGGGAPLVVIAGPCVIEDYDTTLQAAEFLKTVTDRLGIPFIFKASYDKANRSSVHSFRGPGPDLGLDILRRVKERLHVPVLSDVHTESQIGPAAQVLDIIQTPAFLCRQTDFITAVAATGKIINIKKGQFLAPWDITQVVEKARTAGNENILITERGAMFGYNNLVVDFRAIPIMQQQTGKPVIFDATHSVQLPGGQGTCSGGQREFVPCLARAAVAAGADGIFLEVHRNPDKALCDGPNSLPLEQVEPLLTALVAIRQAATEQAGHA